ncbi:MAG: response regulator [Candidatus Sumerlaeaceae bacterium]
MATTCDTGLSARIPRRLLVVDDEQRMATSLKLLLEESGYEVETAFSGGEALQKLGARDFPIVITDLRMGDMDGLDLIRATEGRPGIGFIVITGHTSAETAIEALRLRVVDFISKPFEFEVLRAAVEKAFIRIDADRFREDMLSMITHDIKIPLSSILGYSSLVFTKDGELNTRAREFVQTISSNGLKILNLIDNFLTSCKIDAGKLTIFYRDVNLEYLIEDLTTMFQVELEKNHLKLEADLCSPLPTISGDENLMFRALGNVLSNACKFTPAGGTIRLRTAIVGPDEGPLHARCVLLEVSNTGPGIAPEDLHSIFEKYQRSRTHSAVEGSGIGSYVLRCIVEAHGGCVTATSQPNELTTFSVYLPVDKLVSR